jgi:hypothetical protein
VRCDSWLKENSEVEPAGDWKNGDDEDWPFIVSIFDDQRIVRSEILKFFWFVIEKVTLIEFRPFILSIYDRWQAKYLERSLLIGLSESFEIAIHYVD